MAPRASWKGFLTVGVVSCGVALYAAASTSERISLHMVSRKSGHRLRRQFVDEETGAPVESDAQVKGYETAKGEYITLEAAEVAAVVPESDKTIAITAFVPCADIDTVYLDRPYVLAPVDKASAEAFALITTGMAAMKVAAVGEAVLFRRVRKLLIRPDANGGTLIADTLSFDYEVRPAQEAFADIPDVTVTGEMLDLATHILKSKAGTFDPAAFDDRYESALAELVRAKMEGKPLPRAAPQRDEKVVDLLEALRASAGAGNKDRRAKPAGRKAAKKPATKTPAKAAATKAAATKATAAKTTRPATRRKAG